MNNKVNFLRGTATEYEASTKDNDTFYYTTDDEKLYLGNKEITNGGVTIDDTLSDTSKNPVQNKVINAALNSKANLSDIPTALPADGGNADTVNNKNVEMSIYRSTSSFGASDTDTADTVWKALPSNSIFAIEAQILTDPSWNFPAGTNQYSLLMIKLSNVRPLGMYLCPKSGGNVFFANVDVNGAYAGNWRRLCDGGDAEKVGGYPSGRIMKYIASLPSKDCNEITEPGWYSFNGCDGHAPGSNSTIASGTYFILLNVPMSAPGYFVQVATFIHGAADYLGKTYIRHCNNGVWTEWGNIADYGNATMFDGYDKSKFFKWVADKNTDDDCNDCTESGWYFFNGCKDHSPVNNGAMGMGGYFFLLTYRHSESFIVQNATYVHGTATYLGKTYTRYCNEGVWSNWINIADGGNADGGNADTLDGMHASDITLSFVNKYKPLVVSVVPTSNSVILGWLPVDGATKYAVARYEPITQKYINISTEITNTNYTVTGLSSDTTYQFLVQAWINNKWSTFTTSDHIITNTLPDYNISAGTKDLSAGVSELATGAIYLVYE